MSSITLYFCGTGHDQNFKRGAHALQDTYHCTTSPKCIFDGPGSATGIESWYWADDQVGTPFEMPRGNQPGRWDTLKGIAWGEGMERNVQNAVRFIAHQMEVTLGRINILNMVGHSRGAITAMKVAHYTLHDAFFLLEGPKQINLYLNDPVIGVYNEGRPDENTIPDAVHSAWIIQMEDLSSKDNNLMRASPQLTKNIQQRRVTIPLPGGHGAALEHQKDRNPLGLIGTSLLHQFLQANGTHLQNQAFFVLNNRQYCELYAQAKLKLLEPNLVTGTLQVKSRASTRAAWVANAYRKHTVFVNWHHAGCFEQVCPAFYQCIIQHDSGQTITSTPESRSADFTTITGSMPWTAQLFKKNGLFTEDETPADASSQGDAAYGDLKQRVRNMFGFQM